MSRYKEFREKIELASQGSGRTNYLVEAIKKYNEDCETLGIKKQGILVCANKKIADILYRQYKIKTISINDIESIMGIESTLILYDNFTLDYMFMEIDNLEQRNKKLEKDLLLIKKITEEC